MKLSKGTVYSKALAIFLAASLLLLGAVAALTQLVIMREFNQTENREMKATLSRFAAVLDREIQPMITLMKDWPRRDSLQGQPAGPSSLGESSVVMEILQAVGADFLAVYGPDGDLRKLICMDDKDKDMLLKGDALSIALSRIQANREADLRENPNGFTLVHDTLTSLVVLPIVPGSAGGGDGVIVCGRFFRAEDWRFFEGLFSAQIVFRQFENVRGGESIGREMIELLNKQEVIIDVEKSDLITGYRLIRGVNGFPIGFVSITQERPLRKEGVHATSVFLVGIALAGGALVFLIWFLLDRTILKRISDLTNKLDEEKRSGRLPVKLDFQGSDELGVLARSIEDIALLLERTQSQYRSVVEEQTEVICRFDDNMEVVFANQVFYRTFATNERRAGEQKLLSDFLPESAFGLLAIRFKELSAAKPVMAFAQEMRLASGQTVWLRNSLRGNFSPSGDRLGGQWVAADITSQIEAQRRMLESERRFRRLFETSSDGILLVDGETLVISDINSSLCRQLLLSGSDVLGRSISEISAFEPCLGAVEGARAAGVSGWDAQDKKEFRLNRENNSSLYMELHCSSYLVEERTYMQLNFRNVTERVESDRQLRMLSSKLLRMQDEERRRIARELHDSTAQNLSALEMNMSLLEPLANSLDAKTAKIVSDTREIARECSQELRNISYLLHPPLIDEVGLVFALRWFVDGFTQRTGIFTKVDISPDFPRLGGDVELPLFRVLQEAMTNIYRHAGATKAYVQLVHDASGVLLQIRDDGVGFNASGATVESPDLVRGVGLAGMRERLSLLGGTLKVETTSEGVTVTAKISTSSLHVARTAN